MTCPPICLLTEVYVLCLSFRSTTYTFNPKPANPSFLSHSLVELLSQISPAFKKNFTALQKKRCLFYRPANSKVPLMHHVTARSSDLCSPQPPFISFNAVTLLPLCNKSTP